VENFRKDKGKRTGIIWWNALDCWPQFSDAVIDYYYNWKLAAHYLKNVQQSVLLMFSEPEAWCIRLHGINDHQREIRLHYTVTDLETQQCCLTGDAILPADSSCELAALRVSLGKQQIFRIDYSYDGRKCFNHYLLAAPPVDKNLYKKWLEVFNSLNFAVY
jgi:beta-mannosidase